MRSARPHHAHPGSTYRAAARLVRRYRRAITRRHALMSTPQRAPRLMLATLALAGITALSGCGLLVVGGTAATTASVATDRRTTGEQVEDQAIEMKSGSELRALFGDKARVNTTSYGGWALLTGDVPTEQDKKKAEETDRKSTHLNSSH